MRWSMNFQIPTLAPQQELLSRREAARYLGVAEHTLAVWQTTKRYPLPMVKIGRLTKYLRRDLDAFIARNRNEMSAGVAND